MVSQEGSHPQDCYWSWFGFLNLASYLLINAYYTLLFLRSSNTHNNDERRALYIYQYILLNLTTTLVIEHFIFTLLIYVHVICYLFD